MLAPLIGFKYMFNFTNAHTKLIFLSFKFGHPFFRLNNCPIYMIFGSISVST